MRPRGVIIAAVLIAVWGLATHGTFAGSGDEPHYLMIAQSIAFDADIDLANNYALRGNLIGGGTLQPDGHAIPGRSGVLRPVHDIGLPLLFAPYVRVVYPAAEWLARSLPPRLLARAHLNAALIFRHLITLAMALVAGLLACELYGMFLAAGATARQAMAWALLFVLSPPLLSHAFLSFTEIPSALVVAWLYRRLTSDEIRRGASWVAIGVAIGLLLLIHVRNIAFVAGFGVWAIVELWRRSAPPRDWARLLAGIAMPLAIRSLAMWTFWGTLLTNVIARPDFSMPVNDAVRGTVVAISGLLFDQEFGLLVYAPLYLLMLPGLWLLWRSETIAHRVAVLLPLAYVLSVAIPYVNTHGWDGGWSPPARMITPAMPLFAIAVFAVVKNGVGGHLKRTLASAVTIVVAVQIVIDAVVWQWPKTLWNYRDGTSALLANVPLLQRALPTWYGQAPSATPFVLVAAAWTAAAMLVVRATVAPAAPARSAPDTDRSGPAPLQR